jgi:methylated-DNA-[protein]-cysteine S-methyltransferase
VGTVLPQPQRGDVAARLAAEGIVKDPDALRPWLDAMAAALRGEAVDFHPWPLDLRRIRPFTQRVLEAAREIPRGQTRSYWWLAVRVGDPHAARAVGQVMARNPFPLIVPCHRVVRRDGSLGGFGGGPDLKRCLLALEGCEMGAPAD